MSMVTFWVGIFLVVVGSIGALIGGLFVQKNWGYWASPQTTIEDQLKALQKTVDERMPAKSPEILQAKVALERKDLSLADTLVQISDVLDIIHRNCDGFHRGEYTNCQVVAEQLKKLLCNEAEAVNNSLSLKVFHDLKLHPMINRITKEKLLRKYEEEIKQFPDRAKYSKYPAVYMPHGITGIPGHMKFVNIFDLKANPIPLEEWLSQIGVIMDFKAFTLRFIIKAVAEHSGTTNKYLESSKKFLHVEGTRGAHHHEPLIIAIGEYIVSELRRLVGDLRQL